MLSRLANIFRSDAFVPSSAIFPDIDTERLSSELKLREAGTRRGSENQPQATEIALDHIELSVIEKVEELRRKGLENYEANRKIYNERLTRATEARKEVEIAAGSARNDFRAEVQVWKARFVTPREQLFDAFVWRNEFRKRNKLTRPAADFGGWPRAIALGLVLLAIESMLNGYLFAKRNEMGLLGGVTVAVLVSVCNVGVSAIFGYFSKSIQHRNWLRKIAALAIISVWLASMLTFNVAVAHFRDALESGSDWSLAANSVVSTVVSHPFSIASIESWLLAVLGVLVSFLAFLKGRHTDDSYPGYGHVARTLHLARHDYESALEQAITALKEHRDAAISDLQDANEEVRRGISDSIDALFGQSSLGSHLGTFLEQCDIKVAVLLATYRDANRAARKTPEPASFSQGYKFQSFKPETIQSARKSTAEGEAVRVAELVDRTVKEIFDEFETSLKAFEDIDVVQRGIAPELQPEFAK